MVTLVNLVCTLSVLYCIDAYKILVASPIAVPSVNMLGASMSRHLVKAGHEVTYVTSYPLKDPPKENFTQIDISSTKELFTVEKHPSLDLSLVMNKPMQALDPLRMQRMGTEGAQLVFQDRNFLALLDDPAIKFDVVISDFFETELYAGLAALYDCPMIWSYSMGPMTMTMQLVEQPMNPAYASDYLSAHWPPLSFLQRADQLWTHAKYYFYKRFVTIPKEEAMFEELYAPFFTKRGKPLPDFRELMYNASLIFSNEHHAAGNIPSLPLNYKLIGGFHVDVPPKPLPEHLLSILDNAKHGVIFFSMGSNWKSADMPSSTKRELLRVFGELQQTVVWKLEEELADTPPNVHVLQWAPQQSILAHPKLLFFITQGGGLSSIEAIHYGVPIIAIPIFFDHHINVRKALDGGYGLTTKLGMDTPERLRPLIQEMLKNPKYKQRAVEVSWAYHHRPTPPARALVHWVEHVAATRGAPHLRSPALRLRFHQKYFLDLAALLAVCVAVLALAARVAFSEKTYIESRNRRGAQRRKKTDNVSVIRFNQRQAKLTARINSRNRRRNAMEAEN